MKADQIPVRRLLLPTIGVLACLTALTLAVTLGWGWVVLPFQGADDLPTVGPVEAAHWGYRARSTSPRSTSGSLPDHTAIAMFRAEETEP